MDPFLHTRCALAFDTFGSAMARPPAGQAIHIVPLGGLGEFGTNCLALETNGDIIVVDCGATFPQSSCGADMFHADFSHLESRRSRLRGVVLTHGHEDHIGALPYLLRRIAVPVWAPPHALAIARDKLEERGFDLRQFRSTAMLPRSTYSIGPFEVEPVRVTHSITDACSLVIRSNGTTLVHTGDFKFDSNPPDGDRTDLDRLEQVGRGGVDLLLSDSTNVDVEGMSGSEQTVGAVVDSIVANARGRVVVGLFASNIQRLRLIGAIARKHGRKICLLGSSVRNHVRVASLCGRLVDWQSDLIVHHDEAAALPRKSLLCVATGTQAEALAALSRLSTRSHPALTLEAQDTVVLSSRIIPGNEPRVFRMLDNFIRQDIEVRSSISDPGVHVSGHACRGEQRLMIEILRPQAFLPIHGTLHHLKQHADMARSLGVPEVIVAEDGDVLEFGPNGLRKVGATAVGRIAVFDGEEIPTEVLRQRETLGRAGVVVVTVVVDAWGRLLGPSFVSTKGILDEAFDMHQLRAIATDITDTLSQEQFMRQHPTDERISEAVTLVLRSKLGAQPCTVVHVVRQ